VAALLFLTLPPYRRLRGFPLPKPIVLIAEELSPATVSALGPDFEIKNIDGTDRKVLLAEIATASAILVRSAINLIGSISFGKGHREASDVLGQVYEYFLGMFASAEGKLGGQFYTTPSIVKTLVEVLQPTSGRVYDPCCGSGGMFVQSERFLEAHGGEHRWVRDLNFENERRGDQMIWKRPAYQEGA